MFKHLSRIISAAAALLLAACSGHGHFSLKGTVEEAPDINISIRYCSDDAIQTVVTAVRHGDFEVELPLSQPSTVEISDGNGRVMAFFYAAPGDEIVCTLHRGNEFAFSATGNPVTEAWCAFANPIAQKLLRGSDQEINALVEARIAQHPADKGSAMAFARLYNASLFPARADSVLRSMAPEAQDPVILANYLASAAGFADPAAFLPVQPIRARVLHPWTTDSFAILRPAPAGLTVYAFSGDRVVAKLDSVRPALREMAARRGVTLIDISLASDTFIWKRIAHHDSASWTQAWTPGGTLAEGPHSLAIPRLPFFIITDSTGTQLLRTSSVQAATHAADSMARK